MPPRWLPDAFELHSRCPRPTRLFGRCMYLEYLGTWFWGLALRPFLIVKHAIRRATGRVGIILFNPRSFNPSILGPPRATNAIDAGASLRRFRPLGAPGLDFYRFWADPFPTSIFGWIFDGFWKDFGTILVSFLYDFPMIRTSTFRA